MLLIFFVILLGLGIVLTIRFNKQSIKTVALKVNVHQDENGQVFVYNHQTQAFIIQESSISNAITQMIVKLPQYQVFQIVEHNLNEDKFLEEMRSLNEKVQQ